MVCDGRKNYCRLKSDNSYSSLCMGIACREGEGGCRSDSECDGSLACGTDNCAFGPSNMDCCTRPCNKDSDCLNQECNTDNHKCRLDSYSTDWSKCSQASLCAEGEGDCDEDSECEGSLVCGTDNCAAGSTFLDCCEQEIYKGEPYRRFKIKNLCSVTIFQSVAAF